MPQYKLSQKKQDELRKDGKPFPDVMATPDDADHPKVDALRHLKDQWGLELEATDLVSAE